ncbi:hypothetical protein DICPUDRAFT_75597 [Dictyostelium purpureum]|uniref:Uncharacterized protein n=1 Tax=Dictyostelium purpureum TaxID=5786 RepID=F0ZB44_DICPU|nr:uncharacterized protein DICPUDRAFT_75597 [Dictyostelium purpureum]EGC38829.1 hypothetical protein DICPUDRAFT_75597 [Dictyostelium purpureum]|eukprot:XP_003284623.1 hypothetical protein DICPUDRAFT_75597 [Dictyostelium purpureum]
MVSIGNQTGPKKYKLDTITNIEVKEFFNNKEIESFKTFYEDVQYIPKEIYGNSFFLVKNKKNDISFMKKNIFPTKYKDQGPSFSLPTGCHANKNEQSVRNKIIDHVFEQYFNDFFEKVLASTNDYLNYRKKLASLKEVEAPWFLTNISSFWKKPDSLIGFSFYNPTISGLMSFAKYKIIHRCVHFEGFGTDDRPTDLGFIYEYVNKLIKNLYQPGEFSFDDEYI